MSTTPATSPTRSRLPRTAASIITSASLLSIVGCARGLDDFPARYEPTAGGDATSDGGTGDGGGTGGIPDAAELSPLVLASASVLPPLGVIYGLFGTTTFFAGDIVASESGGCVASWGGTSSMVTGPSVWEGATEVSFYDEVNTLQAMGGRAIPVLGGSDGASLAQACEEPTSLLAEYRTILLALDATELYLRADASWVPGASSVQRRHQALADLAKEREAAGDPLRVHFALPTTPLGISQDHLGVLSMALDAGVPVREINLHTYDIPPELAPNPSGRMVDFVTMGVTAAHEQLAGVLADAGLPSDASSVWSMLTVTPMIGLNHVPEQIFSLTDAQKLRAFAVERGLRRLSMATANRDHPCPQQEWYSDACSSDPGQSLDWGFTAAFVGEAP